jgi:hypothetical protein
MYIAQGNADTAAQNGPSITTDATSPISKALISVRSLTRTGNMCIKHKSTPKVSAPSIRRGSVATPYQEAQAAASATAAAAKPPT